MHKCVLISSTVIGATAGLAVWALLKLFEGRKKIHDKYEDPKVIQKYLMHHYGSLNMFPLLKDIIAKECENFHQRIANLCKLLCLNYVTPTKRILDVGSATGALSFYLSESFEEVVGTDTSNSMINSCEQLKESSEVICLFPKEGGCHCITPLVAKLPSKSIRKRVKFWDEDVSNLVFSCGQFNCVVAVNVITKLSEPKQFLSKISDYVFQDGLLFLADTYTWENGPETNFDTDVPMSSFEYLKLTLSPKWKFLEDRNIPYFIANSERSAEVGNCHFTVWKRASDIQDDQTNA